MKLKKILLDDTSWEIAVFNEDGNYFIGEIVASLNADSTSKVDFPYHLKSDSETMLDL